MPVLDNFSAPVRRWFGRRFGSPSPVQELGWPAVGSALRSPGHDVLLCAPTGSGKTLAAFLWAIDHLMREAAQGSLGEQVRVVYVSPLKALASDIRLNLEEPLAGIGAAARELGLAPSLVRAGLRTGDTPARERAAMLRRPPHILVTTPESLFIMLTAPRFREKLRAVGCVIVDELHALAGNKRGVHLTLTLERLERLVRRSGGARPIRIGLSATLSPVERLGAFLAGNHVDPGTECTPRPIRVVRADETSRELDLAVLAPGPALGPLATHQHWEAMYDAVAELVRSHSTTLVFTLSRRWAERIALNLQKRLGADAVLAHHGSLARAERLKAEQRLKRGELKAIVATASLELGIDVGTVDLVCQVDSPKSVSAAIQRIGRSGHRLGGLPKGRFFALTLDDLVECAAVVRAVRQGWLDEIEIPRGCLDVASQQAAAIAAEEGEIGETELLCLLRGSFVFGSLEPEQLRAMLSAMAALPRGRIRGCAPRIFYDPVNDKVRPCRGAALAAMTSGGTIADSGNYDVVIASEGRKIGDVEEDFAQESSRGDIFALGSMPWRILGTSRGRLMVEPAPGLAPTLPFWQTEGVGRSAALSRALIKLRQEIARGHGERAEAARWLAAEAALDEAAALQAVDYVRRGVSALGAVPGEETLVVERFFDGLGGTQVVIHSPFGVRLNRAFGLALRKRLCQTFDFEIQASAIDDAVLLALNTRHSFALDELISMLRPATAGQVLVQAILDAPMFEVRFRAVASRALALARFEGGRKVAGWIQRLRAQELLASLFAARQACFENRPAELEIPNHPIVAETVRECLEESTDLPGLVRLLDALEGGRIRSVWVDSVAPSPFAHRVLLAWDYSFLDDGERAERRSRTVQMNPAMAAELLGSAGEGGSHLLSPAIVDELQARLDGRDRRYHPRGRDELYDLLKRCGGVELAALARRAGEGAPAMAEALEREGRAARTVVRPNAPEMVIARDDRRLYAAAYPAARFAAPDVASNAVHDIEELAPEPDTARDEIVLRALRGSVPVGPEELAERLFLSHDEVRASLVRLEAQGVVFRGQFTVLGREQWCERYNLEQLHRRTLARLRVEIAPASDEEFARFYLAWNHVGTGARPGALEACLEELAGCAFSPALWEKAILPTRVPGYTPDMLDEILATGQFVWFGAGGARENAAFPQKVGFARRRGALPPLPEPAEPQGQAECSALAALRAFGAQFVDEVAERAGLAEDETVAALWRLAAKGLVTNDAFRPLRLIAAHRGGRRFAREPERRGARRRAAARAQLRSRAGARWAVSRYAEDRAEDRANVEARHSDGAAETALAVLRRHGVIARATALLDPLAPPWPELRPALQRLEYASLARRGYFVRALGGEQYAVPHALEMLRGAAAGSAHAADLVALSAVDPANPYGTILPGCGIARSEENFVVLRAGRVVMGTASRTLLTFDAFDNDSFAAAVGALLKLRSRLSVEMIDGIPALESPWVGAMSALGFHYDGRALVFDGYHGPSPLRAVHR